MCKTEINGSQSGRHTAPKTSFLLFNDLQLFFPDADLKDGGQRQSAQRSENTPPISGLFFLEKKCDSLIFSQFQ